MSKDYKHLKRKFRWKKTDLYRKDGTQVEGIGLRLFGRRRIINRQDGLGRSGLQVRMGERHIE